MLDFYPFRGVDMVSHFHQFGNNFQIVISQSNFHQFLKSQWVLESILNELQDSHLNSSNPWRFDKVTWVFNNSIKSSKVGYFNCLFSKLHNSAKSWSFFKKLGSFELLMVWAARNWSYMLNLTHSRPFYEQITLCASYYIRDCIFVLLITSEWDH